MDIFGFFEQSLQGADIISTSGATDKYRVFIPDWFHGEPADISWYPPQNDEHKKNLGAFFGKNSPPRVAGLVPDYVKAVGEEYPEIKTWGIIGVSFAFVPYFLPFLLLLPLPPVSCP
jgi:hypothetical protein